MPSSSDCWGIEVGANAIKALRLRRSGDSVSVADFEVIPFKKVLTTPDIDAEEQIRVGLDQFLSRHDLRKTDAIVSVPGHLAFARFAKLPPVEPKKIPDIVRFEAVQQIPFPIEQVEWDYQTFQDPDSPDVEVGIFAITKERLIPWLQNFQSVAMDVQAIVLSPVAVFNALNYDRDLAEEDKGTILMDIGTSATDLIISERGRVWLRTIPLGGNHFTEALVRSFKISFSKAEKVKREAATSKHSRQIFNAMRPVYVDLVQEVQKSLGYYQSLNRDADLGKLIGLGSTFRLPGLSTFLKQQLQLDVSRLDAFRKIEAEDRNAAKFAENVLSLAPAYGLALQGLDMETVGCNLLPAPVVRRQVWRKKQPMFIAAAAVAVIAAGLAYGSTFLAASSFNSGENRSKRAQAERVFNEAEQAYRQWREVDSATTSDPRKRIININSTLEYRDLWPTLMRDIDNAIMALDPQPELFSGDVEQIKSIPRGQRRILFVDNMTATYNYDPAATTAGGEETFGARGSTDAAAGVTEPRADPETGAWLPDQPLPHYRVVLSGTTPYNVGQGAAAFIEGGFKTYLESLGERRGVTYTIVPGSVRILSINRVTAETDEPDRDRERRSPRRNTPGRVPGGIPGGIPGGVPGGYDEPDGGRTPTLTDEELMERVLPKPMLADEAPTGDSQFTIEFRVQLRSAAAAANQTEPTDADDAQPAAEQAGPAPADRSQEAAS